MKIREWTGQVVENHARGGGYFTLRLKVHSRFPACHPGQFVMISAGMEPEILLRRPMAIYDVAAGRSGKIVSILYGIVGRGTSQLSRLPKGKEVSFLGPIGNRFSAPLRGQSVLAVAGGIGIAPFLLWAKSLTMPQKKLTRIYFGFRNTEQKKILRDFEVGSLKPRIAIEGPGGDFRGTVVDFVKKDLALFRPDLLLTCGPEKMMDAVRAFANTEHIPLEVSLEAKMACGLGVCLSCVTDLVPGSRPGGYALVCRDGPIFRIRQT